jgi:hypothetical protein
VGDRAERDHPPRRLNERPLRPAVLPNTSDLSCWPSNLAGGGSGLKPPGSSKLLAWDVPLNFRAIESAAWEILPASQSAAPRDFVGRSEIIGRYATSQKVACEPLSASFDDPAASPPSHLQNPFFIDNTLKKPQGIKHLALGHRPQGQRQLAHDGHDAAHAFLLVALLLAKIPVADRLL